MKENKNYEINASLEEKEAFYGACRVLDLRCEYPGYTGGEKFAIISSLTETELRKRFPVTVPAFEPFLVLTEEMGKAIFDYKNNEAKYRMRQLRDLAFFELDESLVADAAQNPEMMAEDSLMKDSLKSALRKLPAKQRKRIVKRYLTGMPSSRIAKEEGVGRRRVDKCIASGLEMLRGILPESLLKEGC